MYVLFYELIISYLKNNKPIALGLSVGLLFGSWLSSFFNWIPLLGNIIGLILTILGGIVGIYITYLIKKEQSGKSTLINLLAARVVSTTKQEKEARKFLKY